MRRWMVRTAMVVLAGLSPAWAKADDQEMAQEIAAALRDSGQLRSYSIGVKYKDGVALLAGRVQDAKQRRLAQQLAAECPGVDQVINSLTVQGGVEAAPARLRQPRSVAGVQQAAMEEDYNALDLSGVESTPAPARTMGPSPRIARAANVRRSAAQETYADAGNAGAPLPINGSAMGAAPMAYDQPSMPGYSWPSYASYPNYAAVTYPKQYSPTAWPYIGPFYPYPQVPLGWRKVTMEWKDGWWFLDFHNGYRHH